MADDRTDGGARAERYAPTPCWLRLRKLEMAGFIKGYHAEINAEAMGFGVTIFAHVGLNSQAENDLKAFEDLVRSWPHVRECHMLAGETDFLLVDVREPAEYDEALESLRSLEVGAIRPLDAPTPDARACVEGDAAVLAVAQLPRFRADRADPRPVRCAG